MVSVKLVAVGTVVPETRSLAGMPGPLTSQPMLDEVTSAAGWLTVVDPLVVVAPATVKVVPKPGDPVSVSPEEQVEPALRDRLDGVLRCACWAIAVGSFSSATTEQVPGLDRAGLSWPRK